MDMRIPGLEWLPASLLGWFAETTAIAAVLAAVAWACGRSTKLGPASRHALWLIVLIKLMMPPLVHWPQVYPAAAGSSSVRIDIPPLVGPTLLSDNGGDTVAARELSHFFTPPADDRSIIQIVEKGTIPLYATLFGAWAVGSLVMLMIGAARVVRFRRRLEFAVPAPCWLIEEADRVAAMLRVRPPAIWVMPGLLSPLLWCLGRPRLLVPRHLLDSLEPDRWRGILAHELAHVRRGDPWVCRLELAAGILWWWNPLYRLVRNRIDAEAELACDAWVVSILPNDRVTFAETLIKVCAGPSRPQWFTRIGTPALGIAGPGRFFEKRLTMILRDHVSCRLSAPIVLAAGLLLIAAAPAWTHATPTEDKATPKPASETKPDSKPVPKPTEESARSLGDRMEKAFGREVRSRLEQYMTEVSALCKPFVPAPDTLSKLLADAMTETLDLTIPKFGPDSDRAKQILAERLAQAKTESGIQPAGILETANHLRGELALKETKKFFWDNVYEKLNLPTKAATFEPLTPDRLKSKAELQLLAMPQGANTVELRKHAEEAAKNAGEMRNKYIDIKLKSKNLQSDPAAQYHARLLKAYADKAQAIQHAADAQEARELEQQQRIEAEFRNDPEVVALIKQIEDKEKELARVGAISRSVNEPAIIWLKHEIIALEKEYKQLWEKKYDQLRGKVMAGKGKDRDRRIRAIEATIQKLLDEVKDLREEAPEADGKG